MREENNHEENADDEEDAKINAQIKSRHEEENGREEEIMLWQSIGSFPKDGNLVLYATNYNGSRVHVTE